MDSALDCESGDPGFGLGGGATVVYWLCPLARHFSPATSVGWGNLPGGPVYLSSGHVKEPYKFENGLPISFPSLMGGPI